MLFLLIGCAPCSEATATLDFQVSSSPQRDDLRGVVVHLTQLEPEVWDTPLQVPVTSSGEATVEVDAGRYEYRAGGTTAESISFESSTEELSLEACNEAEVEIMVYALLGE